MPNYIRFTCECSGIESREYGRGNLLPWPRDTFFPQKLALTLPASDGRSVGIVLSRTNATEFFSHANVNLPSLADVAAEI
jgi:hypothetical protein